MGENNEKKSVDIIDRDTEYFVICTNKVRFIGYCIGSMGGTGIGKGYYP